MSAIISACSPRVITFIFALLLASNNVTGEAPAAAINASPTISELSSIDGASDPTSIELMLAPADRKYGRTHFDLFLVALRSALSVAGVTASLKFVDHVSISQGVPVGLLMGTVSGIEQFFYVQVVNWRGHRGWLSPSKAVLNPGLQQFTKEYLLGLNYISFLQLGLGLTGVDTAFFKPRAFSSALVAFASDGAWYLAITAMTARDRISMSTSRILAIVTGVVNAAAVILFHMHVRGSGLVMILLGASGAVVYLGTSYQNVLTKERVTRLAKKITAGFQKFRLPSGCVRLLSFMKRP